MTTTPTARRVKEPPALRRVLGSDALLPLVSLVLVSAAAISGTPAGERAVDVFLSVVVPAGTFALGAGAVAAAVHPGASRALGRMQRDRSYAACIRMVGAALRYPTRLPASLRQSTVLRATSGPEAALGRLVVGAALSPITLVAAVVAFGIGAGWTAFAAWVVTVLVAAPVTAWSAAGAVAPDRAFPPLPPEPPVEPTGRLADDALDALVCATVGAALVALAAGMPDPGVLSWLGDHPVVAVPLAVVLAMLAAPGPEAGCIAVLVLAPLGAGAQVAFAAAAALVDVRTARTAAILYGTGVATRLAVVAATLALGAGMWYAAVAP